MRESIESKAHIRQGVVVQLGLEEPVRATI